WQGKFFSPGFSVVGVGRRGKKEDVFRAEAQKMIAGVCKSATLGGDGGEEFFAPVFLHLAGFSSAEGMQGLAKRVVGLEKGLHFPGNRLFYLATDPDFFCPIVEGLASVGLVRRELVRPWARVVIEKPFGHDLTSALALDRDILRFLRPDQTYRID